VQNLSAPIMKSTTAVEAAQELSDEMSSNDFERRYDSSYIRMWTTAPLLSKQSRPIEVSLALKRLVLSAYLARR
jgi:hypothetical protein